MLMDLTVWRVEQFFAYQQLALPLK